jgi:hypothetical protein
MLTREIANEVASQWQHANDMQASGIRQFEAMLRAALLITKTQVSIAGAGKNQWDYSGIAAAVMATQTGAVGDGAYDAAYIREIQAMWGSYMAWLTTPITIVVQGQTVTLEKRPIDLIMSSPVVAQVAQEGE